MCEPEARLCGEQIRKPGEPSELVKSWEHCPYFWKAKAEGPNIKAFHASFSQIVREEESEEPWRAAVTQAAQKAPDIGPGDPGWTPSPVTHSPRGLG